MDDINQETSGDNKILLSIEKDHEHKPKSPGPEELVLSHLQEARTTPASRESQPCLDANRESHVLTEDQPFIVYAGSYELDAKAGDSESSNSKKRKADGDSDPRTSKERRSKKKKKHSKKKDKKDKRRKERKQKCPPSDADNKSSSPHLVDWLTLISKHRCDRLPPLSDLSGPTIRASSPGIPCPYDDDPSEKSNPASDAEGGEAEDESTEETDDTYEMEIDEDSSLSPLPSPEGEIESDIAPSNLDTLPMEVRLMVYKQLLVAKKDIRVHSGWQLVYKRQGLSIPTTILRTSRRIYSEAVGVLYGHNVFLYRLRDALPTITDVSQLAHIDHNGALPTNDDQDGDDEYDYDGDESGSEWGGDDNANTTSSETARQRSSRRQIVQPAIDADIHVEKYLHLIRHIVIEAEQNRSSTETKKLMAAAINTFKYQRHSLSTSLMTNIHTLTIRVAPKWDPTGGPVVEDPIYGTVDQHGCFTFVGFFSADSPVIDAIKGVECQFLKVNLMTLYMDGPSTRSGYSFLMDMRYLRLQQRLERNEVDDMWRGDEAMQEERRRKAARASKALGRLDTHVNQFCERYLTQKSWDDEWDAIEDNAIDDGF